MKNTNEVKASIGRHKGALLAACIAVVFIVVIILLAVPSCERQNGTDDNGTGGTISQTARSESALRNGTGVSASSTIAQAEGTATDSKKLKPDTGSSDAGVEDRSGGDAPTGDEGSEPPATPAPEKHWVIDYTQVWVEDSPAWDEQVPVYGYTEVSICNICGADITGNEVAHGKAHMLAGEGSGHHSEVRSVVTGYDTVHRDATGHWEAVESGGHWE